MSKPASNQAAAAHLLEMMVMVVSIVGSSLTFPLNGNDPEALDLIKSTIYPSQPQANLPLSPMLYLGVP